MLCHCCEDKGGATLFNIVLEKKRKSEMSGELVALNNHAEIEQLKAQRVVMQKQLQQAQAKMLEQEQLIADLRAELLITPGGARAKQATAEGQACLLMLAAGSDGDGRDAQCRRGHQG